MVAKEFEPPPLDADGWLEIETSDGGLYVIPAARVLALVLEGKPPPKKKT